MKDIVEGSKKSLEIANICYANVAGLFAMFSNPKYRGPNFTWEWFINYCEKKAWEWMFLNAVKGDKEVITSTAQRYAREIAMSLVKWTEK